MTDPLTPPDCDLRGMPFMPLDIVRLFDSDLYALSTGDEFKAALSLWGKSFLQVPAASLPADERILAHLSGAGAGWKKVRDMAMRGWIECADGRYYHPVVAEKAKDAWEARLSRRARTEAARNAKIAARADSNNQPPPPVTDPVTDPATENATECVAAPVTMSVTENVTGSKGQYKGQLREEREERVPTTSGEKASPPDVRSELWNEGLTILRGLTGKPEPPMRALLGKLLKSSRDDCAMVLAKIRTAADLRPAEPVAWLIAAVNADYDDDTRLLAAVGLGPNGRLIDGEFEEIQPRMLQ